MKDFLRSSEIAARCKAESIADMYVRHISNLNNPTFVWEGDEHPLSTRLGQGAARANHKRALSDHHPVLNQFHHFVLTTNNEDRAAADTIKSPSRGYTFEACAQGEYLRDNGEQWFSTVEYEAGDMSRRSSEKYRDNRSSSQAVEIPSAEHTGVLEGHGPVEDEVKEIVDDQQATKKSNSVTATTGHREDENSRKRQRAEGFGKGSSSNAPIELDDSPYSQLNRTPSSVRSGQSRDGNSLARLASLQKEGGVSEYRQVEKTVKLVKPRSRNGHPSENASTINRGPERFRMDSVMEARRKNSKDSISDDELDILPSYKKLTVQDKIQPRTEHQDKFHLAPSRQEGSEVQKSHSTRLRDTDAVSKHFPRVHSRVGHASASVGGHQTATNPSRARQHLSKQDNNNSEIDELASDPHFGKAKALLLDHKLERSLLAKPNRKQKLSSEVCSSSDEYTPAKSGDIEPTTFSSTRGKSKDHGVQVYEISQVFAPGHNWLIPARHEKWLLHQNCEAGVITILNENGTDPVVMSMNIRSIHRLEWSRKSSKLGIFKTQDQSTRGASNIYIEFQDCDETAAFVEYTRSYDTNIVSSLKSSDHLDRVFATTQSKSKFKKQKLEKVEDLQLLESKSDARQALQAKQRRPNGSRVPAKRLIDEFNENPDQPEEKVGYRSSGRTRASFDVAEEGLQQRGIHEGTQTGLYSNSDHTDTRQPLPLGTQWPRASKMRDDIRDLLFKLHREQSEEAEAAKKQKITAKAKVARAEGDTGYLSTSKAAYREGSKSARASPVKGQIPLENIEQPGPENTRKPTPPDAHEVSRVDTRKMPGSPNLRAAEARLEGVRNSQSAPDKPGLLTTLFSKVTSSILNVARPDQNDNVVTGFDHRQSSPEYVTIPDDPQDNGDGKPKAHDLSSHARSLEFQTAKDRTARSQGFGRFENPQVNDSVEILDSQIPYRVLHHPLPNSSSFRSPTPEQETPAFNFAEKFAENSDEESAGSQSASKEHRENPEAGWSGNYDTVIAEEDVVDLVDTTPSKPINVVALDDAADDQNMLLASSAPPDATYLSSSPSYASSLQPKNTVERRRENQKSQQSSPMSVKKLQRRGFHTELQANKKRKRFEPLDEGSRKTRKQESYVLDPSDKKMVEQ
ncbi:hypothetical protein PZA11_006378 [Diplocarpon coronariae]